MKRPTEEHILNLFKQIELGKVTVTLDTITSAEAIKNENGVFHFDTSNKWRIGVFVDCGKFDYIDYIADSRTKVDYGKLNQYYPKISGSYSKFRNQKYAKKIWGIEAKIYAGI